MTEQRLSPSDQEAEKSLLGCMLRDNTVIAEIVQTIRPEYFFPVGHQRIFEGIVSLVIDQGKPADIVTLSAWLSQNGHLEEAGGIGYVSALWDTVFGASNAPYHAEIIHQKAIARKLIHVCAELQKSAYDQDMLPSELMDVAERRILEISGMGIAGNTKTLAESIGDVYVRLDQRKHMGNDELSGVTTGFIDLDNLTAGLQNSELIIIAARPSVGKTAFALNLLRHIVVESGLPALFVSLEQARIELAERLLCCQARVDSHKLRRGYLNEDETSRLLDAGIILSEAKLFIDDTPCQSMLRISANARRLKLKHKIRIVVVDYLQLIEPDGKRDSRQEQVSTISRRLKFLARELEIPVVALAQVNRGAEDRQDRRPRLSDLRESGAIEQDADTVMLLHRPDYNEPGQHEGIVEVIIGKQRNGPTGDVSLLYVKQFMRFENLSSNDQGG